MIARQLLPCLILALTSYLTLLPALVQAGIDEAGHYYYDDCFDAGQNHSYCLRVPESYSQDNDTEWPVLLFLSGRGTRASLEEASTTATWDGVGAILANELSGNSTPTGELIKDSFITLLVVAPETADVVHPSVITSLVEDTLANYTSTTADQVYISGYSMGCRSTIRAIIEHTDLFAAAACSAGYAEQEGDEYLLGTDFDPTLSSLHHAVTLPVALYYSPADQVNPAHFTEDTFDVLSEAGTTCARLTEIEGASHADMSLTPFEDEDLYRWLLHHNRKTNCCHPATQTENCEREKHAMHLSGLRKAIIH